MKRRNIIVVLRLAGSAGRDILTGILLFARQHPHWHTRLFQMPNEFTPTAFASLADAGLDGIVMSEPGPDETARLLKASRVPIAFIGDAGPILSERKKSITYIRNDDLEIGRMGARYLLSIGRRRAYGFVPTVSRQYWSQARLDGFRDELADSGIAAQIFASPDAAGSKRDLDALRAWLLALPKPAAVMAAWDTRATQIIEAANEARIAVPAQLAVIGVDNDELLDESAVPPLTSIQPDHERLGFLAARELERLMNGRKDAGSAVAFHARPLNMVERESATATAPAAHLITRANRFIARNATKGISVGDVVAYLGVSRRLADLRFQQFNKETINAAITRCRLDAVKKLLATTSRPIKLVSVACGYTDLAYLKTLFKRRFGLTMRDYRAQHMNPPEPHLTPPVTSRSGRGSPGASAPRPGRSSPPRCPPPPRRLPRPSSGTGPCT